MKNNNTFVQQAISLIGEIIPDIVIHLDSEGRLEHYYKGQKDVAPEQLAVLRGTQIHECRKFVPWAPKALLDELTAVVDRCLVQRQRSQLSFKIRWPDEHAPSYYFDLRALPVEDQTILLVRNTTSERLLEEQLAISERMASLGTLAAGVAHEINNPLTYIQCNLVLAMEELDILREGGENASLDEIQRSLEIALDGTQRVAKITKELKHFSKVSEFEIAPLKIKDILDSAIKLSANEIRHRAELMVRYEPDLPHIYGDPYQLTQVFVNILINAAQSFDEVSVDDATIKISVKYKELNNGILIAISDNGVGMPSSVLRRIFDPFFTTKEQSGTGLGLSVSHRIIHDLGGTISAESSPGEGTTVFVSLPCSNSLAGQVSEPELTIDSPKATQAKIMVIEDDVMIQNLIKRILDHHDIHTYSSLHEALRYLDELAPDAIICDLMLPGENGEDLHDYLLKNKPKLLPRTLFITGGVFTPGAELFLKAVKPNLLTKPFKSIDLMRHVDELIQCTD